MMATPLERFRAIEQQPPDAQTPDQTQTSTPLEKFRERQRQIDLSDVLGSPIDIVSQGLKAAGVPTSEKPFLGSRFFREDVPKIIKGAALPTVLETISGAATFALTRSPRATLAAQSTGAFIGEALNQLFGITPESRSQLALSALAPPAASGIVRVGKGIAKRLPGAGAALQEEAIEQTFKAAEDVIPPGSPTSQALFQRLEGLNPSIPIKNLKESLKKLTGKAKASVPSLQPKGFVSTAEELDSLLTDADKMSFQEFNANLKRIGKRIGKLEREGGEELGDFKQLFKAMQKDLDSASRFGGEGALTRALLKDANKTFSKERFQAELKSLISSNISPPRPVDGLVDINTRAIIKQLERGKPFDITRKVLKAEIKDVIKTVKALRVSTPPLPKQRGANVGSALVASRFGAVGGGTFALTGDAQMAGLASAVALIVPEVIERGLTTNIGRKFLRFVVKDGVPVTAQTLAAAMQAIRNMPEFEPVRDMMDEIIQDNTKPPPELFNPIPPSSNPE